MKTLDGQEKVPMDPQQRPPKRRITFGGVNVVDEAKEVPKDPSTKLPMTAGESTQWNNPTMSKDAIKELEEKVKEAQGGKMTKAEKKERLQKFAAPKPPAKPPAKRKAKKGSSDDEDDEDPNPLDSEESLSSLELPEESDRRGD